MLELSEDQIINAIYPAGFYRNKTKTILYVCRELVEKYSSHVPDSIEELLSLKGVGRKTANLVITLGYGWGRHMRGYTCPQNLKPSWLRQNKTPEETEYALREKLPRKYWTEYNTIMVAFGRNICRPTSPICSKCPVSTYCQRRGLRRSR